ncbi:hypothetical protein G7Y89_g8658 [Cudoniella acicularis]|uniref:Nephrocystin 3-like N-terminal domain-containing protein n=1 Tax=Cudoniella acicularis TaxID=354080 RepID=A0A8H4W0D7_9HELO|nr:hypothetical protein G7Y89_g8658 [Cudoniella acicularis]
MTQETYLGNNTLIEAAKIKSNASLSASQNGCPNNSFKVRSDSLTIRQICLGTIGIYEFIPSSSILHHGPNVGVSLESFYLEICDAAARVAEELLRRLQRLRASNGRHRAWESLKAAIKATWSQDEIASLTQRLSVLKESMQSRFVLELGQMTSAEILRSSARFNTLDTGTQDILKALVNSGEKWTKETSDSIAKMLCRLEAVNQDEHHRTLQMMSDLRTSLLPANSPVDVITAQIEMLNVGDQEEEKLRNTVSRMLLEELSYPQMTNRYEEIVEAHPETLEWIFSDVKQWKLPWSDFGKGTNMQKSQQGLLRSLLFQILGEHTKLIPIVFPTRWTELYGGKLNLGKQILPKTWFIRELHKAFERLIDQHQYFMKPCFFVDGLDEFSGDTEQLCLLFQRLDQRSETAKFCLSSRPWVQSNKASRVALVSDSKISPPTTLILLLKTNSKEVKPSKGLSRGSLNLYTKILSQIEPIYFEWASRAFQIMKLSLKLSSDPFEKLEPSQSLHKLEGRQETEESGVNAPTLAGLLFAMDEDYTPRCIDRAFVDPEELRIVCDELQVQLTARFNHHRGGPDHSYELANFPVLSIANDALIYSYHMNGHAASRKIRTELLGKLMDLDIRDDPSEVIPTWGIFLHQATSYSLSDFVEDKLSSENRDTTQYVTDLTSRLM